MKGERHGLSAQPTEPIVYLQNDHRDGLLMNYKKKKLLFISKIGTKGSFSHKNSEISHIWKAYLTLELVKQDKYTNYNVSSILICQAKYYVHTCI